MWQEHWRSHRADIVRYATALCSGDHHAGEDVAQETAIRLWQRPWVLESEQLLRLINDLSTLSMVAQDRVDPDQAESPFVVPPLVPRGQDGNGLGQELAGATRELLERLFPDSDDERTKFARSLAAIAERSGRADYATRVRALFGVPDLDGVPPELADEEPQDD